jgi:guanylate kinase
MAAASSELSRWPEYDYVIVNTDLDQSTNAIQSILVAERLKRGRLSGLSDFVRDMQAVL